MRAGADAQLVLGFRDLQFAKEAVRHLRVVVLAGVEDAMICFQLERTRPQCCRDYGNLDELRTRAHYREQLHY